MTWISSTSFGVIGRRWRVLLVGAVLTILGGLGCVFWVPTNYQAAGQLILLLPPQASGSSTPTNPYLNLEPGLTVAASLIASTVTTYEFEKAMENSGFTSKYSVALNPGAGPILEISAKDTDPAMAVRTRDEVITRLEVELARIQADAQAPERQLIHATTNSVPATADPLPGSKIRALAAIGGVGVTLTLIVAFARDRSRRPASAIPANSASDVSAFQEIPQEPAKIGETAPAHLPEISGSRKG